MTRRRDPRLGGLLVGALTLAALLGGCRPAPPGRAPQVTVVTGSGVTFVLSGAPRGAPVTVTLLTPAGALRRAARAGPGGNARVPVPYARAGLTPYVVTAGAARVEGQLRLTPGAPRTPLTLKVGARAVRVTQPRPPALVLHPLDADGNVTARPVELLIRRPDGARLRRVAPVQHLTAWTLLPPGRVTGLLRVTATTGDAAGEVGEVDLLPGPARRAAALPAAALDVELRDALGNLVAPLEAVTATARDGDWNVEVPLSPVEGRARSPAALPAGARLQGEELR